MQGKIDTVNGEGGGLSSQQLRYSGKSGVGALSAYRDLVSGNAPILSWLGFEAYDLLFSGLPGILGYILRRLSLGLLLRSSGGKLTIGKCVTFRQPNKISLGKGVIIDDFALLDYRSRDNSAGEGIVLEDSVLVGRGSLIVSKGGAIRLRRGSNIGSACRIATESSVDVGEGVLIAAFAYIGPGNHRLDDLSRPIIEQPMEMKGGVKIGSGAWIGAHSIVVDGVTIGKNAVVGANSLVLSDVPEGAIVAGSPAKIVRYREGL